MKEIFTELKNIIKRKALSEWQRTWLFEIIEFKDRDWTEDIDIQTYYIEHRKICLKKMSDINYLKETLLPNLRNEQVSNDTVVRLATIIQEYGQNFANGEYARMSFSLPSIFFPEYLLFFFFFF